MDLRAYCRSNNLVSFDDFLKDLQTKDLIFIGEDHFDKTHQENEQIILNHLHGKLYHLVTEELPSKRYESKKAMFSRFDLLSFSQLPSEEKVITRSILELVNKESPLIAILGNNHLRGIGSVDKLVKLYNEDLDYAVIHQNTIGQIREGIYRKQTLDNINHILVGRLKTICYGDFAAEELTR